MKTNAKAIEDALVIEGFTKVYGGFTAVAGVDLRVGAGEFFSILGPSGSGKTTLLRAVAGFLSPTSGRILIAGEDVSTTPAHRRPCNLVFQNYALFPHMSVRDNVAFGLVERRMAKAEITRRVDAMLELVQLEQMASRRPSQLSGGQQQRVALARALVLDPAVLLLDEPLGALDAKLRKEMQTELKRIQGEVGMTFVYVTHDQGEALSMSDRIAVINQGLVEQVGTPRHVYDAPSSAFVAGFVGDGTLFEGVVDELRDSTVVVRLAMNRRVEVAVSGGEWQTGDQCVLLVRPESLAVHRVDDTLATNRLEGRIVSMMFEGSAVRYHVKIDDGTVVEALVDANSGFEAVTGASVALTWTPCAGRLLPAG